MPNKLDEEVNGGNYSSPFKHNDPVKKF